MEKFLTIIILVLVVIGLALVSSNKAKQIAWPVMEKCWASDTIKIVSLTARPNFRKGFNWRIGAKSIEEGFNTVLENQKYGYVPEILVNILTGDVAWKHFQETGDPIEGCGNY